MVRSKQGLEAVARGEPFSIEAPDVGEAAEMLAVLRANGFVARQLPERE